MRMKGFSLLELMIALVILALVASFAIPSYMAYLSRTRITNMIQTARIIMTAISEDRGLNGSFSHIIPEDSDQTFVNLGIINPLFLNDSISEIQFTKKDNFYMSIVMCADSKEQGATTDDDAIDIYLTATFYTSGMKWGCQYDTTKSGSSQFPANSNLVPSSCRTLYDSSVHGTLSSTCLRERTTIEPTNVETSLPPFN